MTTIRTGSGSDRMLSLNYRTGSGSDRMPPLKLEKHDINEKPSGAQLSANIRSLPLPVLC